ncbi:MAG: ferritin [Anaerolineaceae bacterium]|nr:ferritin [Anaerolineaceae bacterium]
MLISERLNQAINQQVANELGASLQYLHIAAYFEEETLPNLAQFFHMQSAEEHAHAMKFVDFIIETGGKVQIPEVPAQLADFESALETAKLGLKWENEVTAQVYELVNIALEDKNHIAKNFLDWFVNEQLEEVSMMSDLVNLLKRASERDLLLIDSMVLNLRPTEGTAPA